MENPVDKVEQVLLTGPALKAKQFQEIIDFLIGRTERSVRDDEIVTAFENAHANWKH